MKYEARPLRAHSSPALHANLVTGCGHRPQCAKLGAMAANDPATRRVPDGYDFTDKRVLITGGGSGIGAELAIACARRGATVGICGRRADRLNAVLHEMQQHSAGSRCWVADLSDLESLATFAEVQVRTVFMHQARQ